MSIAISQILSEIQAEGAQGNLEAQVKKVVAVIEWGMSMALVGLRLTPYALDILRRATEQVTYARSEFFYLQDCVFEPQSFEQILKFQTETNQVGFSGCGITDAQVQQICNQPRTHICKGLDLSHNRITTQGAIAILDSMKCEYGIDLSFNQIDSTIVPALIERIQQGRIKTKYLDLSGNEQLTDQDKDQIKTALLNSRLRIRLETNPEKQESFDQALMQNGRTRFPRLHDLNAEVNLNTNANKNYVTDTGALLNGHVHLALSSFFYQTTKQLETLTDQNRYDQVLQRAIWNMNRLIAKGWGLHDFHFNASDSWGEDLPNNYPIPINSHTILLLEALFKPDYKTSLTELSIIWGTQAPGSLETMLPLFQAGSRIEKLTLRKPQISDDEFQKLCAVLKTNKILKEFSIVEMPISAVRAQQLTELLTENCTLQELDLESSEIVPAGKTGITAALRTNFFLIQKDMKLGFTNLDLQKYINRNREFLQLAPLERARAMRAVYVKEQPGLAVPAERYPLPTLKEHGEFYQARKDAEAKRKNIEADENSEVKKILTKLKSFLDTEDKRLKGLKQHLKGRDDKKDLYRKVWSEVYDLCELKHTEIQTNRIDDVIQKTAIIAHHRRYSLWNAVASLFQPKYKTATSWKLFTEQFAEDERVKPIIKSFQTFKRQPLDVTDKNKNTASIKSYNEYRAFARG